jgi:hypothetical protein
MGLELRDDIASLEGANTVKGPIPEIELSVLMVFAKFKNCDRSAMASIFD